MAGMMLEEERVLAGKQREEIHGEKGRGLKM